MDDYLISKTLLINKPEKWTSFDVVKKVRGLIKKKYNLKKIKVGHAGTLDPLATGLLVVSTGKNTKIIQSLEALDKKYTGSIKLGSVTDSFDRETNEKNHQNYKNISTNDIMKVFEQFTGFQKQKPPIFSAVKLNGERLYKKARRGDKDIVLKERSIIIYYLKLLEFNLPFVKFEVQCGKGTYIRSLAHDIGQSLGCGAYLYDLKRTEVGHFKLQDALDINNIYTIL